MMVKEKLAGCYERLQTIDIQPTKNNMEKLLQTLYDLEEIYQNIEERTEENGGASADTE